MKIEREYRPDLDEHRFFISVPNYWIDDNCHRHPVADLITEEQALGIIEDAILMSMQLERNRE